jgi:7,8-dihydroneopterin aldolase/epimerase/oxygenase
MKKRKGADSPPAKPLSARAERGSRASGGGEVLWSSRTDSPMHRFTEETVQIANLRFPCIIGVNPEERTTEQPLVVTVWFRADFARAAETDDLKHTVNYADVAREIRDFSRAGRFRLLETLARRLAHHLSERFCLTDLTLHIRKPNAVPDSDGPVVSLRLAASPEP